jgi:N-methylhydantoinase B
MRLDPVLLEILNRKIAAAADEMYFALQRASRSIYVKEAADFGTAVLDVQGLVFGYPPSATFNFLIDTNYVSTIRAVPDVEPGDVIMTNDPYLSDGLATHLPDLQILRPYFHRGRVVAWGFCFIHCTDVGGSVPSSISPALTEIFQEGLRIPPMKIVKKGVFNRDFFSLLAANCREPEVNMGDIKAMLGSMEVGRQRVADLIEAHGLDNFLDCQKDLPDYTAAKARDVLRRIPDGAYEFWDYLDDDMLSPVPLRIRACMKVDDGQVNLDFTGTDPQVPAAYNVPTMGRMNYWLTMRLTSFMTTYDPTMAMNAGLYRSISVTVPPGIILNAQFPDAVGVRSAPGRRTNDVLTGAIFKAAPHLMSAPTCGASTPFVLAEHIPEEGGRRQVMVVQPMKGGMGALKGQDGVDARDNTLNNMKNHPNETVEEEAGVIVRAYDVRCDSGGPGRWRGGAGQMITVEIVRDGGTILARSMERMRFAPWGVAGGCPGRPQRAVYNLGRADERELGKIDQLPVKAGDTVSFLMAGAAGYGNPYRRPPNRVLADVEQGFVSRAGAARDYGVVITDDGVDQGATKRLRATRGRRAGFDFGRERRAWESVFDDATMLDLNRRLYSLPKSVRYETRRRIFAQAVPDLPAAGAGRSLADVLADPRAVRARLAKILKTEFGAAQDRAAD